MADENRRCTIRLLSDAPTDKDAFGPHEKIAGAIVDLITNEDEEGGKAIALTGGWGSGKSTVVKIVKRKLKDKGLDDSVGVFEFDAWAHEGDSLRRAFLERLIGFFNEQRWLTYPESWKRKRQGLSQSKGSQQTTSTPTITPVGILFGFLLLASPLGFALYQLLYFLGSGLDWNVSTYRFATIFFVTLIAGPLIFILIVQIMMWFRSVWLKRGYDGRTWFHFLTDWVSQPDFFSIILNVTSSVQISETIQATGPTSVEFLSHYKALLQEGLCDPERRLLIVLDNLDRMETEQQLSIWATMRTFFEFDQEGSEQWRKRLWMLVPFRKIGMEHPWLGIGEDEEETPKGRLRAFMDKTFAITFDVPEPVLSKWYEYMLELLEKAFPDPECEQDFYDIYRLYYVKGSDYAMPPTPRSLITYINDIGTVYRIWGNKIPLRIQAFYALLCRSNKNNIPSLLLETREPEIQNKIPFVILGDDWGGEYGWRGTLAAMYYNMLEVDAVQMFLSPSIREALENGDEEKIKELKKLDDIPGFSLALHHEIKRGNAGWPDPDHSVALASLVAGQVQIKDESAQKAIHKLLITQALKVKSWGIMDERIGLGLSYLAHWYQDIENEINPTGSPDLNFRAHLVRSLSATGALDVKPPDEEYWNRIDNWLAGVWTALRLLIVNKAEEIEGFTIKGEPTQYINIMAGVGANRSKLGLLIPYCKSEKEKVTVIEGISEYALSIPVYERLPDAVYAMLETGLVFDWSPFVEALSPKAGMEYSIEDIERRMGLLLHLMRNEIQTARAELENLSRNGTLLPFIEKAREQDKWRAIAICIMPFIYHIKWDPSLPHDGSLPPAAKRGMRDLRDIMLNPDVYHELLDECASVAIEYDLISDILGITQDNVSLFIVAVMDRIVSRENAHEFLPASEIIQRKENVRELISKDPYINLLGVSAKHESLLAKLEEAGYSDDVQSEFLYSNALKAARAAGVNTTGFKEWLTDNGFTDEH